MRDRLIAASLTLLLATLVAAGLPACGAGGTDSPSNLARPPQPPATRPPLIEESDIYRRVGSVLYVQNQQTGLNLVNVSNPASPTLLGRSLATAGSAGEMYVRDGQAIIMLKQSTADCLSCDNQSALWSAEAEIVIVDTTDPTRPQVTARWCLPGQLVASRIVGDILFVVTHNQLKGSLVYSLDLQDPRQVKIVQRLEFPDASKEIFVSTTAIFVAGRSRENPNHTSLQMISISSSGAMATRGSITVPGEAQGRFHMDLFENQFRIVTYTTTSWPAASRLTVIDVSAPDSLSVMGVLDNIGQGEKLYATRFDGKLAYVVTFRQTDPLWIVSLADPTRPTIIGELHVPGWSDFLFPRGNYLIAVGRGDRGSYVGVSLFDVSDPTRPRAVQQITLGNPDSTSEATVDHRAAALIEAPGSPLLLAIPHTRLSYSGSCGSFEQLDLVEVTPSGVQQRGSIRQQGTIRRAFLVASALYSLSDYELLAVDIKDRDQPRVLSTVTLGDGAVSRPEEYGDFCRDWEEQQRYYDGRWEGHDDYHGWRLCAVGEGPAGPPPLSLILLGLLYTAARLRRRQQRR